MKKTSLPILLALGLLSACSHQSNGTADTSAKAAVEENKSNTNPSNGTTSNVQEEQTAKVEEVKDVALAVYNLIPKNDLPAEFRNIKRHNEEDAKPTHLFDHISIGECDHRTFTLTCLKMDDGSYKAYWFYETGCDVTSVDAKGAYIFSNGQLKNADFDLPTPDFRTFFTPEDEAKLDKNEVKNITNPMAYYYRFEGDTLHVALNVHDNYDFDDYMQLPVYVWNGKTFVK